ncbi:zinc finger CCCH domain-containing protein 61-like isoform X1 [Cynara cardunculus var. scolymus]|uniref:Zinc finger, CCCH-type n=1 Tax=Cynara cardunculus var. scolymus TaxID=59895 RepID=A0A103Y844_CYNCS|nr:zinc finger CCCH domain-containing protein 61-like isoform X1 [Cynara cardunculus var. scolymus]KVI04283.1 Zinc finger, CCCH-type [Cynara cardunculus var. scolymus]
MDGVCADEEHKFQSAHQLYLATKKPFRDLEIPPRKLLTRRLAATLSSEQSMDMIYHQLQNDSPREETLFQKFLPYNSGLDDDSDPYASDHFRMYEFKIRKCTRSRSHDWTDCPFAHPGEKARRRCPRRFNYSGTVCADFRRGSCSRGDSCDFAHGVFECWLHPSRYRTEACKDGKNCQRKICFFAHTPGQLRSLSPAETVVSPNKHVNSGHCAYCRCHPGIHHTNSPTSILDMDKLSPPTSPPFSPAQPGAGFSPISRFSDRLARTESCGMTQLGNGSSSYKDSKNDILIPQAIKDLMQSMKSMNMNAIEAPNRNSMWMDSFIGGDDQSLFAFSPSTSSPCSSGLGRAFPRDCNFGMNNLNEDKFVNDQNSTAGPDLDWVNDLLT